jgi:phosphoglycolate phosphatase-like HAD superfamily hydrolase
MASYGLPLSRWLPAQADGARFRVLQSEAIALVEPMPGAHDALASAREAAARLVVVTSAPLAIAAGMLEAAGLRIDRLRANVWGRKPHLLD